MTDNLPLLADGNSPAARRARVKLQPRDKKGRWVPTGASLITAIKGVAKKIKGNAIGGTATSKSERNKIRMLVGKGYEDVNIPENTVLTVDPRNAELDTGIKLSRDFLKKKGIDPDVQHTLPKSLADQPQTLEEMDPQPADDLDIELATQGLPEDEDADFRTERDQEPLAKLPPAMEPLEAEEIRDIVEGEPEAAPELGPETPVIDDAIAEIFYGGEAPSVESLVDAAKAPSAKKAKAAAFLNKGEIIDLPNGKQAIVRDIKNSKTPDSVDLTWEDEDGLSGTSTLKNDRSVAIPASPDKSKFAQPAAPADTTPTPAPADDAAPEAPEADTAKPKTVTKPAAKPKKSAPATPKKAPAVTQGRKDDGSDIAPNSTPIQDMQNTSIEQLVDPETGRPVFGKGRKKLEDPNAIYNALLEKNPQAKIDDTDHIVLERADFTDNDGSVYKYEVAVARTHGNQYMERYRFTDSNGDTQTFYHYDYKDSFASIYGDKNGVYTFRDQLLGKAIPGKQPPTRDTLNYFGDNKTLADRIRFFRGKKAAGSDIKIDDLNKTSFKMLTPDEVVKKYLEGRAEKFNKSGQARGTKLQSFVGSAWEAIEQDDMPTFEARMIQLLGRLPDTEESRNLLINTLRDGIKERFNGTPDGRKNATLANNLQKKIITENFDLRDISRRPYSSKDGKTIVSSGDKVRYWNNAGEWSIGDVIAQLPPRQVGNNTYDDIVAVRFGDGNLAILRSNRMDVLGDDLDTDLNLHDKDSDSTDYKPNLTGQDLRDLRGFDYSFGDEERQDDDNSDLQDDQVGSTADQDAAAPYLGEQGVDADETSEAAEPESAEGNIGDFEAGDVWPDEDGDRKGTFVEAQKVQAQDGTDAWAVIWLDDEGNEQIDLVEIGESRVPK